MLRGDGVQEIWRAHALTLRVRGRWRVQGCVPWLSGSWGCWSGIRADLFNVPGTLQWCVHAYVCMIAGRQAGREIGGYTGRERHVNTSVCISCVYIYVCVCV